MYSDTGTFDCCIAAANADGADDIGVALGDGAHTQMVKGTSGSVNEQRAKLKLKLFKAYQRLGHVPQSLLEVSSGSSAIRQLTNSCDEFAKLEMSSLSGELSRRIKWR